MVPNTIPNGSKFNTCQEYEFTFPSNKQFANNLLHNALLQQIPLSYFLFQLEAQSINRQACMYKK